MRAAIALFALLAGCGPAELAATVTIDGEGPGLRLHRGPQGGVHVLFGIACDGCDPEVTIDCGLSSAEGDALTFPAHRTVALTEGAFSPVVSIFRDSEPAHHHGRSARIWVELAGESHGAIAFGRDVVITAE